MREFYILLDDQGNYMEAGPRGYTHREFGQGVPRLFKTLGHAKNALRLWLAGKIVQRPSRNLDFYGADDDVELESIPVPERHLRQIEIVKATILLGDTK